MAFLESLPKQGKQSSPRTQRERWPRAEPPFWGGQWEQFPGTKAGRTLDWSHVEEGNAPEPGDRNSSPSKLGNIGMNHPHIACKQPCSAPKPAQSPRSGMLGPMSKIWGQVLKSGARSHRNGSTGMERPQMFWCGTGDRGQQGADVGLGTAEKGADMGFGTGQDTTGGMEQGQMWGWGQGTPGQSGCGVWDRGHWKRAEVRLGTEDRTQWGEGSRIRLWGLK